MNTGRCLCGGVTWELAAEPFQAFNCHCKLCRKAHGTAFGTYWFMRQGELRMTGGEDITVDYRSSHMLVRKFCGECGSVVPYAGEADDQHFVAPGGCHDAGKPSDCNIFVPHGAPWHQVTGDLPRHDDYPWKPAIRGSRRIRFRLRLREWCAAGACAAASPSRRLAPTLQPGTAIAAAVAGDAPQPIPRMP